LSLKKKAAPWGTAHFIRIRLVDRDRNGIGAGFLELWNSELQYALLERRLDLFGINSLGDGERTLENPVIPLQAMAVFILGLFPMFSLAAQGKGFTGEFDFDIFLFEAGKLDLKNV
jgi:hypothetical protein